MSDRPMANGPLYQDPFAWFGEWFSEAEEAGLDNFNGCAVSTVSAEGQPSTRIVLLKEWDEDGFVFYTNLTSRKGRQALEQGRAAMTFWWRALARQIRIEGKVVQVTDERADAYFATRSRGSQIGAWASQQSMPLERRQELLDKVARLEDEYAGREVPRPPHWSGLRIIPHRIEFWADGAYRLHDRFEFLRDPEDPDSPWTLQRLNP